MSECRCMNPPFHFFDYDSQLIGVDKTKGRFGEVTVDTCTACGRKWLHYLLEQESFSESGRWYRGLVTQEMVETLTPEQALNLLGSLPWHFYGGSFFRTTGRRRSGPVFIAC